MPNIQISLLKNRLESQRLSKEDYDNFLSSISYHDFDSKFLVGTILKRYLGWFGFRKAHPTILYALLVIIKRIFFLHRGVRFYKGDSNVLFVDLYNRADHYEKYYEWLKINGNSSCLDFTSSGKKVFGPIDRVRAIKVFFKNFNAYNNIAKIISLNFKDYLSVMSFYIQLNMDYQLGQKIINSNLDIQKIAGIGFELNKGFILGAKSIRNIKTYTMQHGLGMTNITGIPEESLSDYHIAWTRRAVNCFRSFEKYETGPKLLLGCAIGMDQGYFSAKHAKTNISTSFKKIIYVSSPVIIGNDNLDARLIRKLLSLSENLAGDDLSIEIRLHPSDNLSRYNSKERPYLVSAKSINLVEHLSSAFMVIFLNSTTGFLSIINGFNTLKVVHDLIDESSPTEFINSINYNDFLEISLPELASIHKNNLTDFEMVELRKSLYGDKQYISTYKLC
jgi:hypothetical protein